MGSASNVWVGGLRSLRKIGRGFRRGTRNSRRYNCLHDTRSGLQKLNKASDGVKGFSEPGPCKVNYEKPVQGKRSGPGQAGGREMATDALIPPKPKELESMVLSCTDPSSGVEQGVT